MKLEIQQEHLLVWGDVVGIGSDELEDTIRSDEKVPENHSESFAGS